LSRFPAQEYISGASKIPSVIYYDSSGAVKAVGAEALEESVALRAEEEGWRKAEWCELLQCPMTSILGS